MKRRSSSPFFRPRLRARVVEWLFLQGIGVVYHLAFRSLRRQVLGLVGRRGLLPASDLLEGVRVSTGKERYRLLPTLLWIYASDRSLLAICRASEALSALLVLGFAPRIT